MTPELIGILAVGATLIGIGATMIGLLLTFSARYARRQGVFQVGDARQHASLPRGSPG